MEYYIEKRGRYSRDFTYIFKDELCIKGYVSFTEKKEEVLSFDEIKEELISMKNRMLLICRNNNDIIKKEIEDDYEIVYGKDWIYAEDLFWILDKKHLDGYVAGRRVICWGAGHIAKDLMDKFPFLKISYFVDRDKEKQKKELNGKKIKRIEELKEEDKENCFVIVAAPYLEVKEELERWGWKEGKNFIDARAFPVRPSDLMKQILNAKSKTKWQCHYPFEHVRIVPTGQYSYCFFAEAERIGLGNIKYQDYLDYERSIILKLVRLSVLNGTYVFCDPNRCSKVRKANLSEEIEEYQILDSKDYLKALSVDIDDSCNLHCVSCRNMIVNYESRQKQVLTDRIIDQILPTINILFIAGNGELFLSPYYKQILYSKNYKQLKGIMTLSNGTLCDKEIWQHIVELADGNVISSFSVDAATEETYKKIRRGGNFKKVEENIKYVCSLRKNGRIKRIFLNFVIQKENYKELEQFVIWGKKMGVDYFNITFLDNWGTWTEEEFKKICMYETKEKLLPELQDEIDKLKKYGECVLIDSGNHYREMNYKLLMENM